MAATRLKIRVQPRASKNEVTGWQGDELKVRLTAPPVEGAANEAALRFMRDWLGLKAGQVKLVAGEKSRSKVLEIGLEAGKLRERIGKIL
jgi:uncharacterized protein (TIGR00251 family)